MRLLFIFVTFEMLQCLIIPNFFMSKLTKNTANKMSNKDQNSDTFSSWLKEREISGKGITLQEATYTIRSLGDMLCDGDLQLSPKYQRGYVWKKERAARLIETVLCNRFIPPVILHERQDGRYDVIDGKQRLGTVLSFWFGEDDSKKYDLPLTATCLQPDGQFEETGEEHPLKGLTFKSLPDVIRKRYINFKVSVKVVPRDCDEELIYEIYEDINSGADDLTSQQLRRAVFHGPYIDLIDKLRENNEFMKIRGSTQLDQFEADGEMILRAFAFSYTPTYEFKGPIKKFLNRHASIMRKAVNSDNSMVEKLENEFNLIIKSMLIIFAPNEVCREWNDGQWSDKYSLWLWEGLYSVLKELYDNELISIDKLENNSSNIVEALQNKFEEDGFALAKKTSKTELANRYEILKKILLIAASDKHDITMTKDKIYKRKSK